jgi:phage-related minor tail protein
MSSQVSVHSVEALKDFRVALALYGEDTLAAIGAVEAEVRRTVRWLEQERPAYWQDQIKRRREQVSQAKAEVFRRQLQKRPDYTPAMSEQKENLHKAEASLQDAEKRLTMVRKWQPRLQHAVLEYHASVQRLKDLSSADVPSAVDLLSRLIDALESYLSVQPPSGGGEGSATARASAEMESIATRLIDEAPVATAAANPDQAAIEVEAEPSRALNEEAGVPAPAEQPPESGVIE